jgi:hypothetical protein
MQGDLTIDREGLATAYSMKREFSRLDNAQTARP